MALVEGVGDEVTVLFALLALLALLALAWFSTRTAEREDGLPAPALPAEGLPESAATASGPAADRRGSELRRRTGPGAPEPPLLPSAGPSGAASSSPVADDQAFVLRLKFLNDTERLARVHPQDTVGTVKRVYFPGQEQLVRLIYQGQLLRDDAQTLATLRLTNHSVVHCHISQQRPQPAPTGSQTNVDAAHTALNVGSLMMPLLVLMLAALWYFQLQHRHIFTTTATTCLAGLTLIFSIVAFAVYRR